jgi:hypothetical protein
MNHKHSSHCCVWQDGGSSPGNHVNTCDVIAPAAQQRSARNLVYWPVPSNSVASSNKGLTYHNIFEVLTIVSIFADSLLLVHYSFYCSPLKMEAVKSSETSLYFFYNTWRHIQEHSAPQHIYKQIKRIWSLLRYSTIVWDVTPCSLI